MKQFTIKDIRKFGPCYDPIKYIPEDFKGTAIDILNIKQCPAEDRLWVVLREEFLSDRELRLFAVWCARQALAIPGNENAICSETCNVAERFASGEATQAELAAAWAAARAAARDAARDAAGAAAGAAQIKHLIGMFEN